MFRTCCSAVIVALLTLPAIALGQTLGADPTLPGNSTPAHVRPPFPEWLQAVREEALARGISPATVAAALTDVTPVAQILERDRTQAEFRETLTQYLARRVDAGAIRLGRNMAQKHAAVLGKTSAASRW